MFKRKRTADDVNSTSNSSYFTTKGGLLLAVCRGRASEGIDFSDVTYISKLDYQQIEKRSGVDDGDILFAMIGTIGNPVIVRKDRPFSIKNVALFKLEKSQVLPEYFKSLLSSQFIEEQLNRATRGGSQKFVSLQVLRNLKIPLPPIAQQKRIAAILDKAEELRGLRRQALGALDAIAQSIFLEMFGDPATNPKGWDKGFLGDIAIFVGGGTPKRERPEYFEGSICWATSKDMKNEFLDDTQEYITPQAIEQSATNLVPIGTILIVVKSKILAHSLPVAITRVPTCFGQDIKGIKISERCTVAFVVTALRHSKRWLLERARGINTEGLTLDHLKAFPLMLPPISLQQEFARRVEAIEQLKTTHRESLTQLNALFASLQHRAFRGDL